MEMPTSTSSTTASSPAPRNLRSERQRGAATTTAASSPTTHKKTVVTNKTPPTAKTKTNGQKGQNGSGGGNDNGDLGDRLKSMEERVKVMEEEKKSMKEGIRALRDRLEEKEWQQGLLEEKMKDLEEKLKNPGEGGGGGGGGQNLEQTEKERELERKLDGKLAEIKEVEKRINEKMENMVKETGGGGGVGKTDDRRGEEGGGRSGGRKRRWVVLTDSNAKDATHHSILNHVPKEEREGVEIEVVAVYTLDRAFYSIERGECDVRGATVIVDALTNDVRGTRVRPAVSPQQLLRLVDRLRRKLMAAGARAVTTCQLKPMQSTDVTPFNSQLNDYLRREKERGRDGFGCRTQIRLEYLKGDGFHIRPQFDSVMDKTYACAFLGIPVPNPTPWDEFLPQSVRQRWETDWPRLGGGHQMRHNGR